MFLLEVYTRNLDGSDTLFKRRIAHNLGAIEEWLESNVKKWTCIATTIEYFTDCDGAIYAKNYEAPPIYIFRTHNIACLD